MKIEINRTTNIPNGFICSQGCKECNALRKISDNNGVKDYAICGNFNDIVFWGKESGFYIKCSDCITATRNRMMWGKSQ